MNLKITKKIKPMTRISYAMLYPKIDFKENDIVISDDKRGIVKKTGKQITAEFSGEEIVVDHKYADKHWKILQEKLEKTPPKPIERNDDIFIESTDAELELAKIKKSGGGTRSLKRSKVNLENAANFEWGDDGISLGLEDLKTAIASNVPRENPMKDLKGLTTPIIQKNKGTLSLEDKLSEIWK